MVHILTTVTTDNPYRSLTPVLCYRFRNTVLQIRLYNFRVTQVIINELSSHDHIRRCRIGRRSALIYTKSTTLCLVDLDDIKKKKSPQTYCYDVTSKEEKNREEIQVFSDGSAQGGKVGAAAILIRKDAPDHALHFHLGTDTKHTVHEVELVGMLLALHLIATEKRNGSPSFIAVDNHAALKAFDSDMRRPGHHIAHEFLTLAECLQKRRGKHKLKLTLRWSAGHCGIDGNEKADREAKKAVSGNTSTAKLLPPLLRKPLLINPAAAKRAYNESLTTKWKADWEQSLRGSKTKMLDSSAPSAKFLKTTSNPKLSCEAASRIAQFRLQHVPLNSYLHCFKRVDKANCPACGADNESIAHFLLFCPSYAHERWSLERIAHKKKKTLSLETLLGDPDFAVPLSSYIDGTKHFLHNFGEHTQS